MRYLSYRYINTDSCELTLGHPKDMVSLSLHEIKISNMGQCVKLRNLDSHNNVFSSAGIVPLRNLRRFYSFDDKYE